MTLYLVLESLMMGFLYFQMLIAGTFGGALYGYHGFSEFDLQGCSSNQARTF